jgi:hypothetical protein
MDRVSRIPGLRASGLRRSDQWMRSCPSPRLSWQRESRSQSSAHNSHAQGIGRRLLTFLLPDRARAPASRKERPCFLHSITGRTPQQPAMPSGRCTLRLPAARQRRVNKARSSGCLGEVHPVRRSFAARRFTGERTGLALSPAKTTRGSPYLHLTKGHKCIII